MIDRGAFLAWFRKYVCATLSASKIPLFNAGLLRIAVDYAKVINVKDVDKVLWQIWEILQHLEQDGYVMLFSTICRERITPEGFVEIKCNRPASDPYNAHVVIPRAAAACP